VLLAITFFNLIHLRLQILREVKSHFPETKTNLVQPFLESS